MKTRKVTRRRGEITGEIVSMEEDAVKGTSIEELNGNGAMEEVSMEAKTTEVDKVSELRREITTETFSGESNTDDTGVRLPGDVGAANAGPVTGCKVVFVPVGECSCGVTAVDGGFEC